MKLLLYCYTIQLHIVYELFFAGNNYHRAWSLTMLYRNNIAPEVWALMHVFHWDCEQSGKLLVPSHMNIMLVTDHAMSIA